MQLTKTHFILALLVGLFCFQPNNLQAALSVTALPSSQTLTENRPQAATHKWTKKSIKKSVKAYFAADNSDGRKTDTVAIVGFICSITGLLFAGLALGSIGIVLSAIALGRIKRDPENKKGRGLAIAGLILGVVSVVGAIIALALVL
jgi:Domain of unknown function (DUF4190)